MRPAPFPLRIPRPAGLLAALSCLALLAGCGGGEGEDTLAEFFTIDGNPGGEGEGPFGLYFMRSITQEWRDAAASFRDNNPRYKVQDDIAGGFVEWLLGRPLLHNGAPVKTNPLHSSRVDYAHAVGLTGAGQVIAVVDAGFRMAHEAFAGKTNTQTGTPGLDNHGTMVASIAAGSSPTMVGVAPGADLIFSDWGQDNILDLAAAADEALQRGAVAQNNSWGFVGTPISRASYDSLFGIPQYATWLDALKLYAENGVVVFAISNDDKATTAGLMEALPVLEPGLETAWIAAGNAIPVFDDDGVSAVAERLSAGCLEAARWCLMADGSWYAAMAESNSAYGTATGSSFAAPQVAGALALLAEAFPSLAPHQLRARLLASADNTFEGFTAADSIDLLEGDETFLHAYSTEFGHGFLDIRAALLPIRTLTLTMADGGAVAVEELGFATGGAMGDAVVHGLAGIDLAAEDALGGGFDMAAKSFATEAAVEPLAETVAARALSKDFARVRTAPVNPLARSFEAFPGQTLELTGPDGLSSASLLVGESYGIALSRRVAEGVLNLDLGLKLSRDDGSVMGFSDGTGGGARMAALTVSLSHDLGTGGFFALSGEMGLADLATPRALTGVTAAGFDSLGLDLGSRNVLARGGRRLAAHGGHLGPGRDGGPGRAGPGPGRGSQPWLRPCAERAASRSIRQLSGADGRELGVAGRAGPCPEPRQPRRGDGQCGGAGDEVELLTPQAKSSCASSSAETRASTSSSVL